MKNNKIKRQVLLELEVVEQLEKIAIEKFDAAKHPVTKNPVITDALNLILNLGLKHYYSNYKDNNSPEPADLIPYKDLDSLRNQLDNLKKRLDLFTAIAASNEQSISKIHERLDLIESYKSNYIRGLFQEDTQEDTQEDKKLISKEDTQEDTQEDKKLISKEDTQEDTQKDKQLISKEDTQEDTQKDKQLISKEDTQEDTQEDKKLISKEDTQEDTQKDKQLISKEDTQENTQEDKKLISKEDTQEDTQEDKKLISKEDTQEDTQKDKQLISKEDTQENTQIFPQENSQEDKPDNSPDKDPSTISYSASELANLTGFNRNTLANWLKKGKIPRSPKNKFIIERFRMENNKFVPRKSCY